MSTSAVSALINEVRGRALPKGWRCVRIGDICKVATGGTPSTAHSEYYGGEIRWAKSGDIKGFRIWDVPNRITVAGLENSNAVVHPVGTVLLAMSGQGRTRGTSAILMCPSACSQSVAALLPSEHVTPEILCFALASRYENIRKMTGDNERSGLNLELVRSIEVPIPGRKEQQQLGHLLESHTASVERARVTAEAQLEAANKLIQAKARAAFSKLNGAPRRMIGEVCGIRGGKRLPAGSDFSSVKTGHPYVRVVDFDNGTVNTAALKYIDDTVQSQIARYIISKDDVYISIAGTIGLVGVVPAELDGANLTENAARLVIRDRDVILRDYLAWYLRSTFGQDSIRQQTNIVGQPKLALERIARIAVPVPPLNRQLETADLLNREISGCVRLSSSIREQSSALRLLPSALLRRAFNGEL